MTSKKTTKEDLDHLEEVLIERGKARCCGCETWIKAGDIAYNYAKSIICTACLPRFQAEPTPPKAEVCSRCGGSGEYLDMVTESAFPGKGWTKCKCQRDINSNADAVDCAPSSVPVAGEGGCEQLSGGGAVLSTGKPDAESRTGADSTPERDGVSPGLGPVGQQAPPTYLPEAPVGCTVETDEAVGGWFFHKDGECVLFTNVHRVKRMGFRAAVERSWRTNGSDEDQALRGPFPGWPTGDEWLDESGMMDWYRWESAYLLVNAMFDADWQHGHKTNDGPWREIVWTHTKTGDTIDTPTAWRAWKMGLRPTSTGDWKGTQYIFGTDELKRSYERVLEVHATTEASRAQCKALRIQIGDSDKDEPLVHGATKFIPSLSIETTGTHPKDLEPWEEYVIRDAVRRCLDRRGRADPPYAQHLREGGWQRVEADHDGPGWARFSPAGDCCSPVLKDDKARALYDAGARWQPLEGSPRWIHCNVDGEMMCVSEIGTTSEALAWLSKQP